MTRALEWLTAIRDHPSQPASRQCHVLTMLALRLDWTTGSGFASVAQLVDDAGASEHTVRRALDWARGKPRDHAFFLVRTRRGHRLGNGTAMASEWRLRLPSQLATTDVLTISTGQDGDLNRPNGRSQLATRDAPSRPVSSRPSSPSLADLLAAAVPDATEREIDEAVTTIEHGHAQGQIRSERAYLRAVINRGDAAGLIDEARAALGAAANGYAALRPDWCGQCHEPTRQLGYPDQPRRCPDCHPLASPVIVNSARIRREFTIISPGIGYCSGTADDFRQAAAQLAEATVP